MQKIWLVIGVSLIVGAGLVRWAAIDWWQMRIPEDWHFTAEYIGNNAYPDTSGQLPKKREIMKNSRIRSTHEWSRDSVFIKDQYSVYDIQTGKLTWESVVRFKVDPKTGRHIHYPDHPEMKGVYYLFPRNVSKRIYQIADYSLNVFPMRFIRETTLEDLMVYVFQYTGAMDYTTSYAGSKDYQGIVPSAGQRIIAPKMMLQIWVEPITGNIIRIVEESLGDYFVNEKTGKHHGIVSVWAGETTDENAKYLIQKTKQTLDIKNIVFWWIPAGVLVLGFLAMLHGLRGNQSSVKLIPLVIGVLLIVAAGLVWWQSVASWDVRIPEDWSFEVEYIGSQAIADQSGNLPEQRNVVLYRRSKLIKEWDLARVIIEDKYTAHEAKTNAISWEAMSDFLVNPRTGRNIDHPDHPEASRVAYLFPRNVKNETYPIFDHNHNKILLSFDRTETIAGLETYVYHYTGDLDFTEIYAGTKAYPGIPAPAGQRIVGLYSTDVWVEPNTGNIIKKLEKSTGDYFIDEKSGEKIAPIMVWEVQLTKQSVEQLANGTKQQLRMMRMQKLWIPAGLLVLGIALLGYGFRNRRIVA